MNLSNNDIQYISRETKLTPERAATLCEEERDANLILDAISFNFAQSHLESFCLSFLTYVKLVIFKNSKKTLYEVDEKAYIAKCVSQHLNQLKNRVKFEMLNAEKLNETSCQYSLVATGLFSQKLNSENLTRKQILRLQNGFFDVGLRDVGRHVDEWIKIMRKVQDDGWFKAKLLTKVEKIKR